MKNPTRLRAVQLGQCLALATLLILTGANATAQDLDRSRLQVLDDDRDDVRYQDVSLSRLEDMEIRREGQVIGEVEEILGDESGEPVALVVEFEGEVMGGNDREVIIPLDQLEMDAPGNRLNVSLEDEELSALPTWEA